jgi:serine/threonine-protein kinase
LATPYGRVYGELAYLAPEQITGGAADARTDLYAVGLLMYELLTGARPFRQATPAELAKAQVEAKPVAPRVFKPQLRIPKFIEVAVLRALQKNPANRQKSAGEFIEQLAAEIVPEEAMAEPKEVVLVPDEPPREAVLMPAEEEPRNLSGITGKTVIEPRAAEKAPAPAAPPEPVEPAGPRFVLYEGKEVVAAYPVDKVEMLVGRSPDCDIIIEDATVSRVHARIVTRPNRFVVEDLDSLNGTYINDEAIKRGHIEDSDTVAFGNVVLVFRTT